MPRFFVSLSLFTLIATGAPLMAAVAGEPVGEPAQAPLSAHPIQPLRGLVYDREGIAEVRRQAARGVHKDLVQKIMEQAREWGARSDGEVAALIPPTDSVFAYGMAGDPKTSRAWPRFGREDNMCSWDRPGTVRSPHTGDIYGAAKEGEAYYDPGTGWKREDGKIFYFKGIWNAWVIDRLHEAVDNLSLAYLLTGEETHARRALFILDRLATLRAALPQTGNSAVDWPHQAAIEDTKGFFHYMGNIANQRTIHTAYNFDLLANAPFSKEPSAADNGMTPGENIAKNYFHIYERRYLKMGALSNHGTILIANLITQGVLFGNAEMLKEGLEGMRGFFDNTINRDGDYMEVSGSYGRLGRDYGSRLIVPLTHYDPAAYPNAAEMPKATDYTDGVAPGDDPRWYHTAVGMLYRLPILGRYPQYGDMSMDRNILLDQDSKWLAKHRALYLRLLHWQTTREDWKDEINRRYPQAARQAGADFSLEDLAVYGPALWIEPDAPAEASEQSAHEKSDFMAGKGIAILRSGKGKDARALFMRGGINSWHGHDDQMAIVPYGHGMMLAGEYGYRWSGTPDFLGWGTRSIAHNTVVVNEDIPTPYLYKGFSRNIAAPAASVTGYLPQPPAQLVEMRNPRLWAKAGLKEYRRTAWLIDAGAERYYFVDLFQIIGGRVHDYSWKAPFVRNPRALKVEGIKPKPTPGVWTLAALSGKNRGEPWNQPGKSWGERLNGENGMIKTLPDEEVLPISKWNPQPGNGYGMIWGIKSEETQHDWRAIWPLHDSENFLRAHFLNYDGMTAVIGQSPSMQMEHPFDMVVARRTPPEGGGPLQSRYLNITEVGKPEEWTLTKVERMEVKTDGEPSDIAAIRSQLISGETDLILSSRLGDSLTAGEGVAFHGRNAFVRYDGDGKVKVLHLQEGTRLEAGGWGIELSEPRFQALVTAVETTAGNGKVWLDRPLPEGTGLAGSTGWIDSPNHGPAGYLHNEFLSLEKVEDAGEEGCTLVFTEQSLVIASINLKSIDPETSGATLFWMHGLAGKAGNFSYKGHAVVPTGRGASKENPALCFVNDIDGKQLGLTQHDGLQEGQRVDVLVTKPGDTFTMPSTVTLSAAPTGEWTLQTNLPVKISIPSGTGTVVQEFPAGKHTFKPLL